MMRCPFELGPLSDRVTRKVFMGEREQVAVCYDVSGAHMGFGLAMWRAKNVSDMRLAVSASRVTLRIFISVCESNSPVILAMSSTIRHNSRTAASAVR